MEASGAVATNQKNLGVLVQRLYTPDPCNPGVSAKGPSSAQASAGIHVSRMEASRSHTF